MLRAACIVMVLAPCEKSPRCQIHHSRPQHAAVVEAMMLEEALVLGGEEGLAHQHRNVVVGHRNAALFADLGDQFAVAGVDAQGHRQAAAAHGIHAWAARATDRHSCQQRIGAQKRQSQAHDDTSPTMRKVPIFTE